MQYFSEILANIKMEITQSDSILSSETGEKYAYKKKTKLKKCKIDTEKGKMTVQSTRSFFKFC